MRQARHFYTTKQIILCGTATALFLLAVIGSTFAKDSAVDKSKLPPPANRTVDFETDIQPIFSKSCYGCHGPEKQKSGLRLDVGEMALKGGENGPDILPGNSADSPLIHYVAGLVEDKVMPQKGDRLTAGQVGVLRSWIDQGARRPGEPQTAKSKSDHWAFKAPPRPAIPQVRNSTWPRNPIDNFALSKLEAEKMSPSPTADRLTLIRRLSFDLTGLPPTPEEVARFVTDQSPEAYERLVDRLLASPRYGEHWGRHWLDVVHYGESHGYDKDKPRTNAWPYRDYVIRSFNRDKPYSRFVQEQLAGDVFRPDDAEAVTATGFIAAGPWDFVGHVELPESKTDGLIARYNDRDDMVMTTMSTFQSLTVHCARCHDHKFDPISQEDYYRLQAVFAGVDRANRPFDSDANIFAQRRSLLAERRNLVARQNRLNEVLAKTTNAAVQRLDAGLAEHKDQLKALVKAKKESPSNGYHSAIEPRPDVEKWVQVDLGKPAAIDEVRLIPARPTDFPDTPGFGFPRRLRVEISEHENFSDRQVLADNTAEDVSNPGDTAYVIGAKGKPARFVRVTATRLWERTHDFAFALAELQVFSGTNNVALDAGVIALDSIEAGRWAKKYLVDNFGSRQPLDQQGEPPEIAARRKEIETTIKQLEQERKALVFSLLDEATRTAWGEVTNRLGVVTQKLDALPRPQMVYAAAADFESSGSFIPPDGPRPVHLLRRGDVKRPDKLVTPGAPACLPALKGDFDLSNPLDEGSRRAALALWITDPKNLLTRRSIVNRIWQYHMGRGLVDTPNDFGHMGSAPSHPELLDWLAYWFLDNGESLKKLHKLILTSATYRQSSGNNPAYARQDGDNRFLWRMNRQRLDAESFHDALLFVSGQLDLTMGGPSIQQFHFKDDHSPVYDYGRYDWDSAGSHRRSVYRFIVRSAPDPFMECLDSADPSLLTPKRNTTLTALQALSTLNDAYVVKRAEHFAERLARRNPDVSAQIETAYSLALNRRPARGEANILVAYTQRYGLTNACRLILNSNEFMFVD